MNNKLFSICIPSYNRPKELKRLLDSIDCPFIDKFEIVICEDKSPLRIEIRKIVENFKSVSTYNITYIENEENLGYDRNLKALINNSCADFILFMGDDDMFIPNALTLFVSFMERHKQCGYILRSYRNIYNSGYIETFQYFSSDKVFQASDETYIVLFDKSVFISGFTIKREYAREFETDRFDGSLLYQLYLLAEVCRKYPSAYCHLPITQAIEGGVPYFGSSQAEKNLYTPGSITIQNSINFMKWYISIIDFMSQKYQNNSAEKIRMNMSKYSYPVLAIQRNKGKQEFYSYFKELKKIGLDKSVYFYIYFIFLYCLGDFFCSKVIRLLKKIIGHRPKL